MKVIPTQLENPKGLHQRYFIRKIIKNPAYGVEITDTFMGYDNTQEFVTVPADRDSEYFVMRLESGLAIDKTTLK